MSYGLFDGDLYLYPQVPFFNLELMKYSTYYKRKREIVVFTPTFDPTHYSNYLVRQDYISRRMYSTKYNNITYGGRAFDGENYKSLPLDIELCRPDTALYNKLENKIVINGTTKNSFNTMRRAEHVRLSLDGNTINPQWDKQLKNEQNSFGLILHDYDLGSIDGARELIEDNLRDIIQFKSGARIGMKFPTQINSEIELLKWLQLPPLNQYYSLQYNNILTTQHIDELKYNRTQSAAQKQVVINIIGNTTYQEFITTGINQLLKSILDLRRHRLVFPLIYDRNFFTDIRWLKIMDLIQKFNQRTITKLYSDDYFNRVVPYETFYSFVKTLTKEDILLGSRMPKREAAELFQFVREENYDLFVDFYEYTGEKND